ncbi:MAG: M28 family metallopeptidase [Promethearchaeota archaeon]
MNSNSSENSEESAAINHVKALAYGRKAGTLDEYIAMDYIRDTLKKENITTELEPFLWVSTWALYILFFALLILFMLFVIIISLFTITRIVFGYILILISLYFLKQYLVSILVYRKFDVTQQIQKSYVSHNIITKIKAKTSKKEKSVVIFCAHYDSVSINYSERVINSIILIFFAYLVFCFPINLVPGVAFAFKLFNCTLLLCFLTFFITIRAKNKSMGSIDNASGVAILIELSKIFHNNPLNNTDLIFLWTGVEEMGLFGSKTYCHRNFKILDKEYNLDKSYIINIDMVGSYIGLIDQIGIFKKTRLNKSLNDLLEEIAREKEIPLRKEIKQLSFMSDHTTFQNYIKKYKRKSQVCWFYSKEDSKIIHTSKDTPDKCFSDNLNGCIEICYFALKKLDSDFIRNT